MACNTLPKSPITNLLSRSVDQLKERLKNQSRCEGHECLKILTELNKVVLTHPSHPSQSSAVNKLFRHTFRSEAAAFVTVRKPCGEQFAVRGVVFVLVRDLAGWVLRQEAPSNSRYYSVLLIYGTRIPPYWLLLASSMTFPTSPTGSFTIIYKWSENCTEMIYNQAGK